MLNTDTPHTWDLSSPTDDWIIRANAWCFKWHFRLIHFSFQTALKTNKPEPHLSGVSLTQWPETRSPYLLFALPTRRDEDTTRKIYQGCLGEDCCLPRDRLEPGNRLSHACDASNLQAKGSTEEWRSPAYLLCLKCWILDNNLVSQQRSLLLTHLYESFAPLIKCISHQLSRKCKSSSILSWKGLAWGGYSQWETYTK